MVRKNKNPINLDQRKKDFFWNHSTVNKKFTYGFQRNNGFLSSGVTA